MKRACVIGWPVSHSLSPAIHGYWLKQHGLEGEYVRAAVAPEEFEGFLTGLPARGFCGANITVPHKIEAFRLCALRDGAAQAIGAVNTVWIEAGELCGSNSDAYGFAANLDHELPGWDRGGSAVVIGAGGAARAIVYTLVQRGFEDIRIVNRGEARARELAALFPHTRTFGFEGLNQALGGARLLVNCSVLGMTGNPPLDADLAPMATNAAVCDIVYNPLETSLLRLARERGLVAVDGIGMLLHQAVPGFEKWFGVRPEVTPGLRQAVLGAIAEREKS
jgi:shikimate dehydrogenase